MKTKKKVSKKLKKSWRKHVDISDVEAYLDDKRLEERLGAPFEKRQNEDLFQIDKKPQPLIRQAKLLVNKEEDFLATLTCFKGLDIASAVPDPVVKRNKRRSKTERQHPVLKKKNEERRKKGILKKKEVLELKKMFKQRLNSLAAPGKHKRPISVSKDLWADESGEKTKIDKLKKWLNDSTYLHAVRNVNDFKSSSVYHTASASTVVPSFEIPHPGVSYNPTFNDHLKLINEIAEKEAKLQKRENHLNRVTHGLFKQITKEQNEKNWINEMSEGLPINRIGENVVRKEGNESDSEYKAINPPVTRNKKKTIKQRKKQLRLKQEEFEREETKKEKKKVKDICRIKNILQEVDKEDHKREKRSLKRLQKSAKKFENARRVGKNKFEDTEVHFNQISELAGSLRELIPQGNILRDKFRNMQKRNLIEVTKPQFKNKKKKVKKYAVQSHRLEPVEFSAADVLKNKKFK